MNILWLCSIVLMSMFKIDNTNRKISYKVYFRHLFVCQLYQSEADDKSLNIAHALLLHVGVDCLTKESDIARKKQQQAYRLMSKQFYAEFMQKIATNVGKLRRPS